jgi:hypothetical protein
MTHPSNLRISVFLAIWLWPVILAVLSLFGLLAALLGQGGVWWILSWISLGVPVVTILVCIARDSRHAQRSYSVCVKNQRGGHVSRTGALDGDS